jgi:rubredoxin
VIALIGVAALALLVGLFYGLGTEPRQPRALQPPPPELPPAGRLPGGDPGRAIEIDSPAVVERHAERWPCPVCRSAVRCTGHRVEHLAGRRLRVAEVRCPRCGFARDVFFVLRE